MNTWDAVHDKRAIRDFAARPLRPEHLERILDAGRRAHSSKNQQRWGFVVVRDRANLQAFEGRYGDYVTAKVGKVFPQLKQSPSRPAGD